MNVDDILEGDEYFYCEAMHCRMKKALCLEFQAVEKEKYLRNKTRKYDLSQKYKPYFSKHPLCLNCEQGERLYEKTKTY